MTWKRNVLVVANVTASSDELLAALTSRQPATFTLVIPATPFGGGRAAARETLESSLQRFQSEGLEAEGILGDADPCVAVTEAWDPKLYDEIIVSTLPMRFSKWLHAGLPERIARLTGAPVTHVVSAPPRPAVETTPAPTSERGLGPLTVLGWGGPRPR